MPDHKKLYGIYIRAGMLASAVVTLLLFMFIPYAEIEPYRLKAQPVTMVEQIGIEMDKYNEPPPAERPKVAVAAPLTEALDEAVETISPTDFTEDLVRTQPSGPEIEVVPFYKAEIKPEPIYMPTPEYPQLAQKAGIQGTTVVEMLIDIDGSVMEVRITKSSGNQLLDEAAISSARACRFTPAKQREKLVRVWVVRPITFKLK
jgi:protein TonB